MKHCFLIVCLFFLPAQARELKGSARDLFAQKCVSCHLPSKSKQKFPISFKVSDLVESGRIKPGDPYSSPLFKVIDSGEMPPKKFLSNPEIRLVKNYIIGLKRKRKKPLPQRTFLGDIYPLFQKRCFSCHNRRYPGYESLPQFETHKGAVQWALAIKDSVYQRRMPPFINRDDGSCAKKKGSRYLSLEEMEVVSDWIDQGMKKGKKRQTANPDVKEIQIKPDLVAKMERAYTPPLNRTGDNYQCFVLKLEHKNKSKKINKKLRIKGYEFFSTNPNLIHHALVWNYSARHPIDIKRVFYQRDAATPEYGWDCIDEIFAKGGGMRRDLLLGWVKGLSPKMLPAGTALEAKNDNSVMIAQIHFNNTVNKGSNLFELRMLLAEEKEVTEKLTWTTASIPTDGSEIAHNVARVARENVGPLRVVMAESSTRRPVPMHRKWIKLYGVLGHMHFYGKQVELSRKTKSGYECVSCVDRWNMNWQEAVFLQEPMWLSLDDTYRLRCVYDTTRWHPNIQGVPKKPVILGPLSRDEMCINFMLVSYHKKRKG